MASHVELHPAFVYDCDECGRENFVRSIVGEFDEETLDEMREDHGITEYEAGDWHSAPRTVKCQFCGSVFATYCDDNE
jgi:uncharacterized Zn finger protein